MSIIKKVREKQKAMLTERRQNAEKRRLLRKKIDAAKRQGKPADVIGGFRKELEKVTNTLAKENGRLAIAAIQGGIRSRAWQKYMEQFVENDKQLARLTAIDPLPHNEKLNNSLKLKRAYLVANAVCTATSATGYDHDVFTIDVDLEGGCGRRMKDLECEECDPADEADE